MHSQLDGHKIKTRNAWQSLANSNVTEKNIQNDSKH